jgi:hypothetical protein
MIKLVERKWQRAVRDGDPRVRADFESRPQTRGDDAYWARGLRITELVKAAPIDVDRIARADEEFRGLLEFIRQHTRP